MLRASAIAYEYQIDTRAIADPSINLGVPGSTALIGLVDAVMGVSGDPGAARRTVIDELGPEALVDAASVFGNFEMMNRVAEATGIPVAGAALERESSMVESLGLHRFLKHS